MTVLVWRYSMFDIFKIANRSLVYLCVFWFSVCWCVLLLVYSFGRLFALVMFVSIYHVVVSCFVEFSLCLSGLLVYLFFVLFVFVALVCSFSCVRFCFCVYVCLLACLCVVSLIRFCLLAWLCVCSFVGACVCVCVCVVCVCVCAGRRFETWWLSNRHIEVDSTTKLLLLLLLKALPLIDHLGSLFWHYSSFIHIIMATTSPHARCCDGHFHSIIQVFRDAQLMHKSVKSALCTILKRRKIVKIALQSSPAQRLSAILRNFVPHINDHH